MRANEAVPVALAEASGVMALAVSSPATAAGKASAPNRSSARRVWVVIAVSAVAGWVGRRYGVEIDPGAQVLPLLGSKEIVFSLAAAVIDPSEGKDLVLVTTPGYPIAERGARFVGADVRRLPLLEANDFLPDLDAIDDETWDRAAILWLNYPNNPTGAVASVELYRRTRTRLRG